jgi:hypothetical protein
MPGHRPLESTHSIAQTSIRRNPLTPALPPIHIAVNLPPERT